MKRLLPLLLATTSLATAQNPTGKITSPTPPPPVPGFTLAPPPPAYAPMKLHVHRKYNYMMQPWVKAWRRHPILHQQFKYVDIERG